MGIFHFGLKTPQNSKKKSKNGQNHQIALLSYIFHQKNSLFDVDLFSRCFDMESPGRKVVISICIMGLLVVIGKARGKQHKERNILDLGIFEDMTYSSKGMCHKIDIIVNKNQFSAHY